VLFLSLNDTQVLLQMACLNPLGALTPLAATMLSGLDDIAAPLFDVSSVSAVWAALAFVILCGGYSFLMLIHRWYAVAEAETPGQSKATNYPTEYSNTTHYFMDWCIWVITGLCARCLIICWHVRRFDAMGHSFTTRILTGGFFTLMMPVWGISKVPLILMESAKPVYGAWCGKLCFAYSVIYARSMIVLERRRATHF